MEGLSPLHVIVVLVLALVVLGPGRLPETGAALGRALREFRRGMSEDTTIARATRPGGSDTAEDGARPTNPPAEPPTRAT